MHFDFQIRKFIARLNFIIIAVIIEMITIMMIVVVAATNPLN